MILKQMTPLQQRLALSGVGTFIAFTSIFLAPVPAFKPIFILLIAAVICLAMWELYRIFRAKGLEPADKAGITLGPLTRSPSASPHNIPKPKCCRNSSFSCASSLAFSIILPAANPPCKTYPPRSSASPILQSLSAA